MRKILLFTLSLFLILFFNSKGNSQTITLQNVSVINEQGHVRLTWDYNGTNDLYISRDKLEISGGTFPLVTIIDTSVTSFIDQTAQAHLNPRAYRIAEETSINSKLVSTYHLTTEYDSCLQQIKLNWIDLIADVHYNEWTPSQFSINIIEDGIPQDKIPLNASINEYTIENLSENKNYTIFIETQWSASDTDPDSTVYSNPIIFFTQMPISPDYIKPVSTVVDGNTVNVKFDVDPNTELETYKLLKSSMQTGNFDTIETYISTNFELIANDNTSNPSSEVNYYKLISVNQCGNETTNSGLINNIVLKAEIEDFEVSLSWNGLNEGSSNSVIYDVYRIIGNNEYIYIGSRPTDNTSFIDDIEEFQNNTQFCYFVQATPSGTISSDYSQSNIACTYLKPKVFVPEAFTPNGDGRNDYFKAVFSFVPKEFDFKVYNRWGNKVFETSNYSEAWDGTFSNGKPAPTGSYIYTIKITSPNGQIVEQRGSVMVIHP